MRINRNILKKELANQGLPILEKKIMPKLEKQFERAKQAALLAFENHPVTKEIEAGKASGNSSGTLGGEGSLYSFIGFNAGDDPISKLREFLSSKIKIINKGARKSDMVFYISVDLPSEDDLAEVTPLPWAPGRSWAEGIEKGLAGPGELFGQREFSRPFRGSNSGRSHDKKFQFFHHPLFDSNYYRFN